MAAHRKDYKTWKAGRTHSTSCYKLFDKYGVDNLDIILLESVNAKSYDELISRETYYFKKLKCVNLCLPKNEERTFTNEKRKEYKKLKYNCDCGSELRISHKFRHNKTIKHQEYMKTFLML